MKKLAVAMFLAVVLSGLIIVSQGCKSSPTTPATSTPVPYYSPTVTQTITPTSTNTPTFTATCTITPTITPDNSAQYFTFEDATTQGWSKYNGAPATMSCALTTAIVSSGTYGLEIGCAYSSSDDLVEIHHAFAGTPMNLRAKNVYAWVYLSAAFFANGTFHPELTLVSYGGAALPAMTLPDITASGWYQAAFTVPDTIEYEMIGEVRLGLKNDLASTNTEFLYIDNITWM